MNDLPVETVATALMGPVTPGLGASELKFRNTRILLKNVQTLKSKVYKQIGPKYFWRFFDALELKGFKIGTPVF